MKNYYGNIVCESASIRDNEIAGKIGQKYRDRMIDSLSNDNIREALKDTIQCDILNHRAIEIKKQGLIYIEL